MDNADYLNLVREYENKEKFDLIVFTDIFELSNDIFELINLSKNILEIDGTIIISSTNTIWRKIIKIIENAKLKETTNLSSYIKPKKVESILKAFNFSTIKQYNRIYVPFRIFGIGHYINNFLYFLFPFLKLGLRNYIVIKGGTNEKIPHSKTIIIPAKNEEGNLEELINRVPSFTEEYEILLICGNSKDKTYEKALQLSESLVEKNIKVYKQTSNGKANAVWDGIKLSSNEVIAILDADLSVDPEQLVNFFSVIENGSVDFVNGTRLIYSMENSAMRKINKLGNRLFQYLISKVISVNLTDTLCGTKVFKRKNIEFLWNWQNRLKIEDPFCDFDLLFSAAFSALNIVEVPVHYRARTYGTTNIARFKDGKKLFIYLFKSYFVFRSTFKVK